MLIMYLLYDAAACRPHGNLLSTGLLIGSFAAHFHSYRVKEYFRNSFYAETLRCLEYLHSFIIYTANLGTKFGSASNVFISHRRVLIHFYVSHTVEHSFSFQCQIAYFTRAPSPVRLSTLHILHPALTLIHDKADAT